MGVTEFFRFFMILNPNLKTLAKILADRLQTAMPCVIGSEQCSVIYGRTMQESLHLVRTTIAKVDGNIALINLD